MTHDNYGYAICPVCQKSWVNLNNSQRGYGFACNEISPTKKSYLELYFYFCEKCLIHIESLLQVSIKKIKRLMSKVLQKHLEIEPFRVNYAITTNVLLIAHEYNISDAHYYGLDITRELHDAIFKGEISPLKIADYLRVRGLLQKNNGSFVLFNLQENSELKSAIEKSSGISSSEVKNI